MKNIPLMFIAALPLAAFSPTGLAQDLRVNYLEQEVRDLKRQVLSLTQRLDRTDSQLSRSSTTISGAAPVERPALEVKWVDAKKWRSLRSGMSELEVIELLGRPSSTRDEGGVRVALYAMEIGDAGFLGGSVRFRDGKAVEIKQPSLQ